MRRAHKPRPTNWAIGSGRERRQWFAAPVAVRAAIAAGEAAERFPIMLADHADNTGGGAPGDSTEILRTFHELQLRDALLLYLVDPEAALAEQAAGVGARIHVALGGKSSPVQGPRSWSMPRSSP